MISWTLSRRRAVAKAISTVWQSKASSRIKLSENLDEGEVDLPACLKWSGKSEE